MKAFYADHFVLPLPSGHRFPMVKYRMLRDAVLQALPDVTLLEAPAATDGELALAHQPAYVRAIADGTLDPAAQREIGFPWTPAMAERARRSVGGTIAAARAALQDGVAANLAGGTHHAYAHKGSGFCVFNDVAVTARLMQTEVARVAASAQSVAAPWALTPPARGRGLRVAVVDLDVHQGNGTASIFQGDDSVFTLSLHGEKNFPFRKEASDLDVELPDGCNDDGYMQALAVALETLERRFDADMVIYLAGADVHEGDRLGRLKLTADGMQARDRYVMDWAWQRKLPLVMTMAGGYGHDIAQTVAVQVNSYRIAREYALRWQNRRS